MKHLFLVTATFLLCSGVTPALAQSGYELFQQALVKERAEGNAEAALALYERIGKEHASNRELAAKALLQVGLLHEKLGHNDLAQEAFQAVVSRYSDFGEIVRRARTSLASIPAEMAAGSIVLRQIDIPDNSGPWQVFPDGRHLSGVDWETGDLGIYDIENKSIRRLTNKGTWDESGEFALYSCVSNDGTWIAYSWWHEVDGYNQIKIIKRDGTVGRTLYKGRSGSYIRPYDWSPDQQHILAYVGESLHESHLGLIRVSDGTFNPLKRLVNSDPSRAVFSPDGRYITFDDNSTDETSDRNILLFDINSGIEIVLVDHPGLNIPMDWSPDGKSLYFASTRNGSYGVWKLDIQNGMAVSFPYLIKNEIGPVYGPLDMTTSGSLFFATRESDRQIFTASIDLETGRVFSQPAPLYVGTSGSSILETGHWMAVTWYILEE